MLFNVFPGFSRFSKEQFPGFSKNKKKNQKNNYPCEGPTTNEYLQTIVRNGLKPQMEHHQTCAIWCSGAARKVGWNRIRNSDSDQNVAEIFMGKTTNTILQSSSSTPFDTRTRILVSYNQNSHLLRLRLMLWQCFTDGSMCSMLKNDFNLVWGCRIEKKSLVSVEVQVAETSGKFPKVWAVWWCRTFICLDQHLSDGSMLSNYIGF